MWSDSIDLSLRTILYQTVASTDLPHYILQQYGCYVHCCTAFLHILFYPSVVLVVIGEITIVQIYLLMKRTGCIRYHICCSCRVQHVQLATTLGIYFTYYFLNILLARSKNFNSKHKLGSKVRLKSLAYREVYLKSIKKCPTPPTKVSS